MASKQAQWIGEEDEDKILSNASQSKDGISQVDKSYPGDGGDDGNDSGNGGGGGAAIRINTNR